MVIVRLNHTIVGDLPLHAEMKPSCVRGLEARVDRNRNLENLRNREVHGEVAKTSPEEEPWVLADCGAGGIRELLWIEAGHGLDSVLAHHGVDRNRGMARSDNSIQVIDPKKRAGPESDRWPRLLQSRHRSEMAKHTARRAAEGLSDRRRTISGRRPFGW